MLLDSNIAELIINYQQEENTANLDGLRELPG